MADRGRGRGRGFQGGGRGGQGGGRGQGGRNFGGSDQRAYQGGGGAFRGVSGGDRGGFSQRGGRGRGAGPDVANEIFVPSGALARSLPNRQLQDDANSLIEKLAKLELVDDAFPHRPGFGKAGVSTIVRANFFKLDLPTKPLYHYDVDFIELKDSTRQKDVQPLQKGGKASKEEKKAKGEKRLRLFELLLQHPEFRRIVPNQDLIAHDKSKTIISATEIKEIPERIKKEFQIRLYWSHESVEDAKFTYVASVIFVRCLDPKNLERYVLAKDPNNDKDAETSTIVRALNIILAKFPSTPLPNGNRRIVSLGNLERHFIVEKRPLDLGNGLVAYVGYYSSVRPAFGQVLVNINTCMSAFFPEMSVADFLMVAFGDGRGGFSLKSGTGGVKPAHFKDLRVEMVYTDPKTKKEKTLRYKLSGLGTPDQTPDAVRFDWEDKKNITITEYFKLKYNIKLEKRNLPCLVINISSNRKGYLPPECFNILAGQPFSSPLDAQQTRKMLSFACRPPKQNAEMITGQGLITLGHKVEPGTPEHLRNKIHQNFGMKVHEQMEVVQSRIFSAPTLQYLDLRGQAKSLHASNASWNLREIRFPQGGRLKSWAAVIIKDEKYDTFQPKQELRAICEEFKTMAATHGIDLSQSQGPGVIYVDLSTSRSNEQSRKGTSDSIRQTAQTAIKTKVEEYVASRGGKYPDFLLAFLPSNDKHIYSHLRYLVDIQWGIPTVCSVASKALGSRNQKDYLANLLLKANPKLGGVNHTISGGLDYGLGSRVIGNDSIILGADVTHPGKDSVEDTPSIVAVVGSFEDTYSLYPGCLKLHKSKKEEITVLKEMVEDRLEFYARTKWERGKQGKKWPDTADKDFRKKWPTVRFGLLPNKILYFRDGVSESQYVEVNRLELKQIRDACASLSLPGKMYAPKITIVVCGKRHHTRFYPTEQDKTDKKGNCAPGTVIDRGVTDPYHHDFYLQAHACLQGTAKSCHYYVTYDDIGFTADKLQQLVHNLSYLYSRATKAVSYVPPAYCADKLCDRGRCYLLGLLHGVRPETLKVSSKDREKHPQAVMEEALKVWNGGPKDHLLEIPFYL